MEPDSALQQLNRMIVTNFNSSRPEEAGVRKINFQPQFQSQIEFEVARESATFEPLTAQKNPGQSTAQKEQTLQDFGDSHELLSYKAGFSGNQPSRIEKQGGQSGVGEYCDYAADFSGILNQFDNSNYLPQSNNHLYTSNKRNQCHSSKNSGAINMFGNGSMVLHELNDQNEYQMGADQRNRQFQSVNEFAHPPEHITSAQKSSHNGSRQGSKTKQRKTVGYKVQQHKGKPPKASLLLNTKDQKEKSYLEMFQSRKQSAPRSNIELKSRQSSSSKMKPSQMIRITPKHANTSNNSISLMQ